MAIRRPYRATMIRAGQWRVGNAVPDGTRIIAHRNGVTHSNPYYVTISIANPWEVNWWR